MSLDKQAKQHMIDVRTEVIRQGRWPTCTNCQHWEEHPGLTDEERVYNWCAKYQVSPPEQVVVVGCVNHEPGVPF